MRNRIIAAATTTETTSRSFTTFDFLPERKDEESLKIQFLSEFAMEFLKIFF